jgi:hypothetical protein
LRGFIFIGKRVVQGLFLEHSWGGVVIFSRMFWEEFQYGAWKENEFVSDINLPVFFSAEVL